MPSFSPSIAAYLDALPDGERSYPDCKVKASIVRNAVGDRMLGPDVALPPAVRALIDSPPPVSVWVPEVQFYVLMHGIRDAHFGGRAEEHGEWVYAQNRKLFSTVLYRAIFFVVSPERLLVNMEKRWESFRVGTTLSHERIADRHLLLKVRTPPSLYSTVTVEGMQHAVRAAIDAAGAKHCTVEGALASRTEVVFRARWE
jgi:hypothetical protein